MYDEYSKCPISKKPIGQQILNLSNNSQKKSPRSIWKRWKKKNRSC